LVGIIPELREVLTHYHHMFNKTDTSCCQIKMGMVVYLGADHHRFLARTFRPVLGWSRSRRSRIFGDLRGCKEFMFRRGLTTGLCIGICTAFSPSALLPRLQSHNRLVVGSVFLLLSPRTSSLSPSVTTTTMNANTLSESGGKVSSNMHAHVAADGYAYKNHNMPRSAGRNILLT